jgi:hypothetical protein
VVNCIHNIQSQGKTTLRITTSKDNETHKEETMVQKTCYKYGRGDVTLEGYLGEF